MTPLVFEPYNDTQINGTYYQPELSSKLPIVYLHGGGLIFGERDDLPNAYLKLFLQAGHPIITLDYLLGPEATLDTISSVLLRTLEQLNLGSDYILFGRSAGAFLSNLLLKFGQHPQAFISFYGYFSLDYPEFRRPAPFYTKFPRVLPMEAAQLVRPHPITSGIMSERYPLYLSARQFGTWLSLFLSDHSQAAKFSLSPKELQHFPKTILAHCKKDPDVPFSASVEAAAQIPESYLLAIDQTQHDFDRIVTDDSLRIYERVITLIS